MSKFYRIIIAITLALHIGSCAQTPSPKTTGESLRKVNAQEFNQQLEASAEKQIIDVRTPEEFSTGYIAGAENINIYDADFEQRINKLDKNKTVFVYCKGGGRSADAAAKMKSIGFQMVYDLQGGIMSWTNNNLPVVKNGAMTADKFLRSDYDKLLKENQLVLIDYYAPWCGPCKKMEPVLAKLTDEYSGKVAIVRINVDEAAALSKELRIENIPVITTHKNGQEISHVSGFQSEDQLRSLINELLK
jgi:thioredoxin 1